MLHSIDKVLLLCIMPAMTKSVLKLAVAASIVTCSSCTNFYQKVMDYGAVYSGVEVAEPGHTYAYNGKTYIKGQRAQYRRTYTDPKIVISSAPDKFEKIAGTEGAIVYRELTTQPNQPVNPWIVLPEQPTLLAVNGDYKEQIYPAVDPKSRTLTPHALYCYPLGLLTASCVDAPLTAIPAGIIGVASIPCLPFFAYQQHMQQQLPMPHLEPLPAQTKTED